MLESEILVDTLASPVLNDFRYNSIALSDVSEGIRLRIGFIVTRASLISLLEVLKYRGPTI